MSTKDQVRQYISETFLFGDGSNLKEDDSLSGAGYVDSTGVIELVAFLEQTFDLRIEDNEIIPENLDSVARISTFIEAKKLGLDVPKLQVSFA
jgi:acyl carrier protein